MPIWQRKPWLRAVGREGWRGLLIAEAALFALGGAISLLSLLFWSQERASSAFRTTLVTMGLLAVVRGFAIWSSRGDTGAPSSDT